MLGAVVAAANGGNAVAGGSSTVAAELAADYLAKLLDDGKTARNAEGKFDPNLLGEDVKANTRDLSSAIAAVVGGVAGDSAFNAQVAGGIGQNAVENN
ncbi:VENN motif pre-toxin domain-containing protein [Pseudomonas sp. F1_0610]|uniref:VENN motif pre-toxin domain-containing protein n=1 Tax=Pseudomonas sp. F1_0610 TaxID=3114284 RepID=UPI0039C0761D